MMGLVACTDVSEPPAVNLEAVAAASLVPIVPPTGTISSRELVQMFAENCVRHFPDVDAMREAFVADGFVIDERGRPNLRLKQEEHGLFAVIGSSPGVDIEPSLGESVSYIPAPDDLGCDLAGDVSDPEASAAVLRALVNAEGEPLVFDGTGLQPDIGRAAIERDGITYWLVAKVPRLVGPRNLRDYGIVATQGPCSVLPECRYWLDTISLSIGVTEDDLATLRAR